MSLLKGEEIAYRTLSLEQVADPCIVASWCMKRAFFQHFAKTDDIYLDAPRTTVEAFLAAGANLCPQFILPSPAVEFQACDPFDKAGLRKMQFGSPAMWKRPPVSMNPEDIRDLVEELPDPDSLASQFDVDKAADDYAKPLLALREMARGEMLFIQRFWQPEFAELYSTWGYDNYLLAMAMYPDHIKRYYEYSAAEARLYNDAIVNAVQTHGLAPFVYGGQDICFNSGPICSVETLNSLYFPSLERAIEPLLAAGIRMIWHCDGDIRPILDRLIRMGMSGFQGFQEETGCTLEHVSARRNRDGEKLVLLGSVSVTTTLPYGTVEEVRADVERCFRVAAPGGGFAIASTSSILPETPLENIVAMYEHSRSFGRSILG